MSKVDKIMALADECTAAAAREGYMPGGFEHAREALRAAIVEALDMGEPVAWLADWQYEHLVSGHATKGPVMTWIDPKDQTGLVPLYAAKP